MINITSKASGSAGRLSNFTPRPFKIDGISFGGMEGALQGLKCPNEQEQVDLFALHGREAQRKGQDYNNWKDSQILWFQGVSYPRLSTEYFQLVSELFTACYEQDETFKEDLLSIGFEEIRHYIGNPDPRDTVLTEVEMLYQLDRLRILAFGPS